MVYTYVFKQNPSKRDFKSICRKIESFCPGYAVAERQAYEGGIENVRWVKGNMAILAELETAHGALTVCSDEPLPRLDKLCKRWEKRKILFKIRDFFIGSPSRVKFIFLPMVLLLLALMGSLAAENELYIAVLMPVVCFFKDITLNGVYLGQSLLIPIGIILTAAANRQAKPVVNKAAPQSPAAEGAFIKVLRKMRTLLAKEADFLIMLCLAALPTAGAVYGCRKFSIDRRISEELELLSRNPLFAPLAVYLLALPYLIIGEKVISGLEKRGKRPSARAAAFWGVLAASAALSVILLCSDVTAATGNKLIYMTNQKITAAAKQRAEARQELIALKYGGDLENIARYALENNYLDWSRCPDEELESAWENIFLSGIADYDLQIKNDSVIFDIPGIMDTPAGNYSVSPEKEDRK